jgi:hypothetical protein
MDLGLIARVIWRFRRLLIAGVILATFLAAASVWKIGIVNGSPKLAYRQNQTWVSYSRLLVTQSGFPQGRTDINNIVPPANPADAAKARQFGDSARFVEMAMLYSKLAVSQPVRTLMAQKGPIRGAKDVSVTAVQDLPIIEVAALGESRAAAIELAQRQADGLRAFIADEQRSAGVPADNRIDLQIVERAGAKAALPSEANTWVISGRSIMRPMLIFVVVCLLFFGLAMMLENLNPRLRAVPARPTVVEDEAPTAIRSA